MVFILFQCIALSQFVLIFFYFYFLLVLGALDVPSMCESKGHVFPLLPSSPHNSGHSSTDLFYVCSVLVVTQPKYAVKHVSLCSTISVCPFCSGSLYFLLENVFHHSFFPPFKRKFWLHRRVSEPFVGLRHIM